jgi:predicted SAM-dependent methyltransferase
LVRQLLGRSRTIRGLRDDAVKLRHTYLSRRKGAIRRYLDSAPTPALHLGASHAHLAGWLETDIEPTGRIIYLDATRPYPFPDGSFQYVFAEHMIEHVPRDGARVMLSEVRRVLRPGGVLRLTTPDLDFLLKLREAPDEVGRRYMDWIAGRFLGDATLAKPTFVINNAFRAWGHQFLYDAETLEADLRKAGFARIERVGYGESSHDMLRGIERHHVNVGEEDLVRAETMIFEAC